MEHIVKINGEKCKTINEFYAEISKGFLFPSYFSNNLDSLDECLNDLSWLNAEKYILIIENISLFLSSETNDLRYKLLNLINEAIIGWSNGLNLNEDLKPANFELQLLD